MKDMEIMDIFSRSGAYKQGHFKLSSGMHSGIYLQCALVLQDPIVAARLCAVLAEKFRPDEPDIVVGPAMGGIVLAYELARALNARAIFTERNSEGKMLLRRGFRVFPVNKVLIAEDVLTTGKSVKEVISILREDGVTPVGVACLADRNAGKIDFGGIKHESLIKLDIPVFKEKECPFCQEGIPLVKPGSRA
ncbi:MAG: orotate phosphoribosyltransferase [Candidatus Makaraimicrobium thalassicum]|nr:MAG: orotate phosphoribosyltransferase [Candidatus Omnitrophota bacterium]